MPINKESQHYGDIKNLIEELAGEVVEKKLNEREADSKKGKKKTAKEETDEVPATPPEKSILDSIMDLFTEAPTDGNKK